MKRSIVVMIVLSLIGITSFVWQKQASKQQSSSHLAEPTVSIIAPTLAPDPLTIAAMKQKAYPGSSLVTEQTLAPGTNCNRYLVSYNSDGLKQYGLLTVPTGQKPSGGWPVILFHHGYIPPAQYSTENSYAAFIQPLASAGFIVFKPDYRGNGRTPGVPKQIYISADYLTDSMNALASIKIYPDANPQRIGVFGHSMGGNIVLHELVISPEIKAAALVAGVVGDEAGIVNWWKKRIGANSIVGNDLETSMVVKQMLADHGTPHSNPPYWNNIDPTNYLVDSTAAITIHVGTADMTVPPEFSSSLRNRLQGLGKTVEYHEYQGADHTSVHFLPDIFTRPMLLLPKQFSLQELFSSAAE